MIRPGAAEIGDGSTLLRISCNGCGTAAYVDCACPQLGHDPAVTQRHHEDCGMTDLGATVVCPPGSGCCNGDAHLGVSHDQAANACPQIDKGTHGPCPEPDTCKTRAGMHDGDGNPLAGPCPGGHCHQGLTDCGVCRTVTIEVLPGTTTVSMGG